MSELMQKFDSICRTNGDDTAFYTCHYNYQYKDNNNEKIHTVGFSELNSNINLIASELYNRHSLRPAFTSSNRPNSHNHSHSHNHSQEANYKSSSMNMNIPSEEFMKEAGSRCVLIVSDQPSPGETAAVMACTRLHITFVPLALDGPHRTNDSRVKVILQETKPIAAIVVLSVPEISYQSHDNDDDDNNDDDDDDWKMKPALASNEYDVDSHPTIIRLNKLGIHRIVTVKGQDGTVFGSMAGIANYNDNNNDNDNNENGNNHGMNSPFQTEEKMEEDGRDPMYILYTSGSTSSKPKAVMQTYYGLWNRINWQWRTFPFVQQMRIDIGLKETMKLLWEDGILVKDDRHHDKDDDYDHHHHDGGLNEQVQEINDIVLRRTSLSFVDSMAEIFGTLLGGASLFCPLYIEDIHMNIQETFSRTGKGTGISTGTGTGTHNRIGLGILDIFDMASRNAIGITRLTCLPSQLSQAFRHYEEKTKTSGSSNSSSSTHEHSHTHMHSKKRSHDWTETLDLVIVSGEPCPRSLPILFSQNIEKEKGILVNLYGQTESSGDVSCFIASSGRSSSSRSSSGRNANAIDNVQKLFLRFPEAQKYVWQGSTETVVDTGAGTCIGKGTPTGKSSSAGGEEDFIQQCSQSLIPCGLPIDGHTFKLKYNKCNDTSTSTSSSSNEEEELKNKTNKYGILYVSGPGVALGYFNNRSEMIDNFVTAITYENKDDNIIGSIDSKDDHTNEILFNTMDVAYQDSNGFLYVIGRAAKDALDASTNTDGTSCSLTMGKVNGVMIHAAEVEEIFSTSMQTFLLEHKIMEGNPSSSLNVIAILHKDDKTCENKSAVFVDLSSFPSNSIEIKKNVFDGYIIDASNIQFKKEVDVSFHDLLIETRAMILRRNHPSMTPHYINFVSSVPTNGAAGKVDKVHLANMLAKNLAERRKKDGSEIIFTGSSLLQVISSIFSEVLNIDTAEMQERHHATFPELGGDSMMAIHVSHRIMSEIQKLRLHIPLSDDQKVTSADIMQFTFQTIVEILENGRRSLPPENKKSKNTTTSYYEDSKQIQIEQLPTHAITYDKCSKDDEVLTKIWKIPLSMCVDSRPLVIDRGEEYVVIAGSQGGDLACVSASGKLLSRTTVTGKIEGDLSYLSSNSHSKMDSIIFVPSYVSNNTVASDNGIIHALKLSESNTFMPLWTYTVNGEMKSRPTLCTFGDKSNCHRLLAASYNGSLSLLDAITGELLQLMDALGGAIHADPVLLKNGISNCQNVCASKDVIVASCSWKGKVTCLTITQAFMTKKWELDLWTPIYASPYVNHTDLFVILCGVDGSVRSLNCNNGVENWKTLTGNKPIFTTSVETCFDAITDTPMHTNTREIVFGSNDGNLRCVDGFTGVMLWSISVNAPILSSPICILGKVLCATTAGSVLVFETLLLQTEGIKGLVEESSSKNSNQIGEEKVKSSSSKGLIRLDGEIFSSPSIKGNDVFIGCRDSCLYKLTFK